MNNLRKLFFIIILAIASFNCGASEREKSNTWFFDTHLMSQQFTDNDNFLVGVFIANRFTPHWYFGVDSSVNTTENNNSIRNGKIYPISQIAAVVGYSNNVYQNINYQVSIGIGSGIGEFTETGSDTVGVCECLYEVIQIAVELNYALSLTNTLAIQLNNMKIDNGNINDRNTATAIAFRHSW